MAEANFSNRTVWVGDNLHVMRGINSECIDLIYLDPPFNSNQDYAAPIGSIAAGANVVDTLPKRTDLGELPNYRTHRHRLYGEQEGVCLGCETHFPFKVMEVDHILPTSRGGTDHFENLQLLCTRCNKSKGSKTMAEWRAGQGA